MDLLLKSQLQSIVANDIWLPTVYSFGVLCGMISDLAFFSDFFVFFQGKQKK